MIEMTEWTKFTRQKLELKSDRCMTILKLSVHFFLERLSVDTTNVNNYYPYLFFKKYINYSMCLQCRSITLVTQSSLKDKDPIWHRPRFSQT